METRRVGSLEASAVGIGCNNFGWRLDAEATTEVVGAALEAGINFLRDAKKAAHQGDRVEGVGWKICATISVRGGFPDRGSALDTTSSRRAPRGDEGARAVPAAIRAEGP